MNTYIVTLTSIERRTKDVPIAAGSAKQAREVAAELIRIHGTKDWNLSEIKSINMKARLIND